MSFTLIAIFVFGTCSLFGHVMVEKARRDGIQAVQRLNAAVASQGNLARQIEVLSNERDLVAWAKRSGFAAPDAAFKSSGSKRVIVARR